jgi:hypothetical protein
MTHYDIINFKLYYYIHYTFLNNMVMLYYKFIIKIYYNFIGFFNKFIVEILQNQLSR